MPCVTPDPSNKDAEPFVEVDPMRRYIGIVQLRNFIKDASVIDRLSFRRFIFQDFEEQHHYNTLNFIIEVCTSGNLREYRKKHCHIVKGLEYLHTHEPWVIHRDLNCCNIGDLGLETIVGKSHAAHSVLGTLEFMALELYEEYTELVDIYLFDMCVLEMVTLEIPCSECDSVLKIYKKVMARDSKARAFIEKSLLEY
uniref:non-specific serine/threonine protein kinase n=1 Tax=Nelumbo nucifera TaxID=4432 RepID=A0A822ZVC9_NELNU|nr:TPA_asm: hypothetical protein HUJ06_016773 [Nelumbo nucifera]